MPPPGATPDGRQRALLHVLSQSMIIYNIGFLAKEAAVRYVPGKRMRLQHNPADRILPVI